MDTKRNFIGLDPSHGKDVGILVTGVYINGFYFVDHTYILRPVYGCSHRFDVSDGEFEFCIHCGTSRPVVH